MSSKYARTLKELIKLKTRVINFINYRILSLDLFFGKIAFLQSFVFFLKKKKTHQLNERQ